MREKAQENFPIHQNLSPLLLSSLPINTFFLPLSTGRIFKTLLSIYLQSGSHSFENSINFFFLSLCFFFFKENPECPQFTNSLSFIGFEVGSGKLRPFGLMGMKQV